MVEYSIKKQNLFVPLIGALIFVVLGILMATSVIGAEEGAAEIDRIGGIVLGWMTILFFGAIAIKSLLAISRMDEGPAVVMDENGFYDRRICIKPIPWKQIRKAYIFRGKTLYAMPLRFISLDVVNPEEYQRTGIDRFAPRLFILLKKLYDEPGITIQTGLLDQSPEDILAAIEQESQGIVDVKI